MNSTAFNVKGSPDKLDSFIKNHLFHLDEMPDGEVISREGFHRSAEDAAFQYLREHNGFNKSNLEDLRL